MYYKNPDNGIPITISDTLYDEKEELLLVSFNNGNVEAFYGVIKEMNEEFKTTYFREKYFYDYIKNVYDYYFVKY